MLSADPERPERHDGLPTHERVHRGDVVALHRVWRSRRSPVCGAASAGKHHCRRVQSPSPYSFTCISQSPAEQPAARGLVFSFG